ncbi:hypothetical protein [Asticcacaulis sp.]|uniref:hypothetical protein n=1 Tax=Asticcacaulis sp. TaxID=1872648 RepID=UPI002BC2B405|nr:hypothetical protein [Asticcacaulis sp.]HTM82598.1 hypothetical protein [Asticcacaulis sp.]
MNAISHLLPAGYMTGQFDVAGHVLASSPSPERLLDLLLLADQHEAENEGHAAPRPGHWDQLRDEAGAELMQLLDGNLETDHLGWRDPDTDWQPKMFRHALNSIAKMDNGGLLTLFIQASETAYLREAEPMQARWGRVAAQCREEILRRVAAPKPPASLNTEPEASDEADEAEDGDADADDYVSLRQVLRVAEDAFESELSDAKLLDLYVLVHNCGAGPDDEIFDEILDPITEMLQQRIDQGSPDLAQIQPVEGFDYPDHHAQALAAVLTGRLSNKNLLTIYRIAWDCESDSPWMPVADLCRAQILRRMKPLPAPPEDRHWRSLEDWKRAELVRRVEAHDQGGSDETQA